LSNIPFFHKKKSPNSKKNSTKKEKLLGTITDSPKGWRGVQKVLANGAIPTTKNGICTIGSSSR
jgi:hypothetical protein